TYSVIKIALHSICRAILRQFYLDPQSSHKRQRLCWIERGSLQFLHACSHPVDLRTAQVDVDECRSRQISFTQVAIDKGNVRELRSLKIDAAQVAVLKADRLQNGKAELGEAGAALLKKNILQVRFDSSKSGQVA